MDREEVIYYFKNKTSSSKFNKTLQKRIESSIENGFIYKESAKEDLY